MPMRSATSRMRASGARESDSSTYAWLVRKPQPLRAGTAPRPRAAAHKTAAIEFTNLASSIRLGERGDRGLAQRRRRILGGTPQRRLLAEVVLARQQARRRGDDPLQPLEEAQPIE